MHDFVLHIAQFSGSQTVVRESFLSSTQRYRPTVFTMPSDHDVTTSAVHFVFKLISTNDTLVLLRHKYTIQKANAFSVCLSD